MTEEVNVMLDPKACYYWYGVTPAGQVSPARLRARFTLRARIFAGMAA